MAQKTLKQLAQFALEEAQKIDAEIEDASISASDNAVMSMPHFYIHLYKKGKNFLCISESSIQLALLKMREELQGVETEILVDDE